MTAPLRYDDLIPKKPKTAPKGSLSYDDLIPASAPAASPIEEEPKASMGWGIGRSVAQGLPFVGTFTDELEAVARAAFSPSDFATAYPEQKAKVTEELAQFRKQNPGIAYSTEIGTGLVSGGLGSKLLLKGGKVALNKALQSAAIQGGLAGAGAAEGGVGERLVGGTVGATTGAVLGRVLTPGTKVAQRDLARDIAGATAGLGQNVRLGAAESLFQRAARGTTELQRKAADALMPMGGTLGRFGQFLEPTDAIKIQRAAAAELPRGATAEVVAESARKATRATKEIGAALKTAEAQAQEAGKRVIAREKKVLEIGAQQAKRDAKQVLDAAETQARELIGDIRAETPNTSAIQDVVRSFQLAEGDVSYDLVRKMGRPPEPDAEVYRELIRNPKLRGAYNSAMEAVRGDLQNATPGMPTRESLPSIRIDGQDLPELSLEMLDQVRRNIRDGIGIAPGETGLSRSAQRRAMQEINRLEERFLAGYGNDAAANAIKAARQQYRARFEQLEALQDGLSIGMAKAGKAAKVVGKNRMELDEFVRRAQSYQGASKEMFKAGAAKWFDNLVTEGLGDDAVKFLQNATKSEGQLKRLRLAFDDETIAKMQQFAGAKNVSEQVKEQTLTRAGQLAQRAVSQGQQRAAQATREVESLAQLLAAQRDRAGELVTTARAGRMLQRAMGDTPSAKRAQDTFAETMMRRLGTKGQQTMQEIAGSDIQRQLSELPVEEARAFIQSLQRNRATKALLSPQLASLERAAQPGPRVARPTYARFAGGAVGGRGGTMLGRFLPFGEEEE